jgi:hypothetical protein
MYCDELNKGDSLIVKLYITSKTSPLNNLEGFTFINNNDYKP